MRWLAALLILTALAGCVQDAPETEDPPVDDTPQQETPAINQTNDPPVEEVLEPFSFSGENCHALIVQHIDEFSVVGDLLPPGFVPADFMSLLKLQDTANYGQGVFGPVPVHCASNTLNGNEFSFVLPGTLVDHPTLEPALVEAWIQGYMIEFATDDDEIADLFERYHWTVNRNASFEIPDPELNQELPNPGDVSRVPAIRAMALTGIENDAPLINAQAAGGVVYHLFDPDGGNDIIRFYHDAPEGLTYIDSTVDRHGLTGSTTCDYGSPPSRFADVFGRDRCNPEDSISIMIYDFTFETTLIFMPGVHA